ncbi:hypothetical protein [Stratiformator vulcanicus]|nr:hypothetical protein [Stratiformator vulcanicus]
MIQYVNLAPESTSGIFFSGRAAIINSYLQALVSGLQAGRRTLKSPSAVRFVPLSLGLAAVVAIYIVMAIALVPPGQPRQFNFVDERGAITALSAIFLAIGCGFGSATFLLSAGSSRAVRLYWMVVSAALGFVALDELLEFHERIGDRLDRLDLLGLTSSKTIRGWNDVIVILYGVIAVVFGLLLLPTVLRYLSFLRLIGVAVACFVVHTAIDTLTEPPTLVSVIVEESAKLYCSLFIAIACLAGLMVHAGMSSTAEAGQDSSKA